MDETSAPVRLIPWKAETLNTAFETDLLALLPRLRRFAIGLSGNPSDGLVSLSLVKLCGTKSVRSYVPMVPSKVSMVVPGPTAHHAGRAGEIE